MSQYILGLNYGMHNSSACLIDQDRIIAYAEEERFVQKKHTGDFPQQSIDYCLKKAGIGFSQIDKVAFYWNPAKGNKRIFKLLLNIFYRPLYLFKQFSIWLDFKSVAYVLRKKYGYTKDVFYITHHLCHAASAFYLSSFEKAAILTLDGNGEDSCGYVALGDQEDIKQLDAFDVEESIALLYGEITEFLGFRIFHGEGKVMGLASFGDDSLFEKFSDIISFSDKGRSLINSKYFNPYKPVGKRLRPAFFELIGNISRRKENAPIEVIHENIASALQWLTQKVMLHKVNYVYDVTKQKNLCLAGGIFLNCNANAFIKKHSAFENIFIQPAANDSGCSIGAALALRSKVACKSIYEKFNVYLGISFTDAEIESYLKEHNIEYRKSDNVAKEAAKHISDGKVIALFNGSMEVGPRALGGRSIMADPRRADMKDYLNSKIKFREAFRPYAPVVLADKASEFFEDAFSSPHMLYTFDVKPDKYDVIPSVVHVDKTARVQTVSESDNPLYYNIINEFFKITGVPVLLNTSFNTKGKPVVADIKTAVECFFDSEMDYLVLHDYIVANKKI